MAFNWDFLVSALIIIGLILTIWAKVSGQTIAELIRDLRDLGQDKKEEVVENAVQVYA